jgi:hypothetical protein
VTRGRDTCKFRIVPGCGHSDEVQNVLDQHYFSRFRFLGLLRLAGLVLLDLSFLPASFLWRAMLEIHHRLLPGGSLLGTACTTSVAVAGQELPRFWGCTRVFPPTAGLEILDVRLPVWGREL